jgi:hypothetical protein
MARKKELGKSVNGFTVVDRHNSHLHSGVAMLIRPALKGVILRKEFEIIEYDFGFIIGHTHCVVTSEEDRIVYRTRDGRNGPTPFAINRRPEACTHITMVLKKISDTEYVTLTAYVGMVAPPEPWDVKALQSDKRGFEVAFEESIEFWSFHALVEED